MARLRHLTTEDDASGDCRGRVAAQAGVRARLELTKDMVRKALPRLSATAEIELVDGRHVVVDPLFAEWIERINQGASDEDAAEGHATL
jgi:hypothetical protein